MIETINGIDLLFAATGSLTTWAVCRTTAAQRRRLAVDRERTVARQAATTAYRMGHEDGLFDRHVMFGTGPARPKTGLQGLLDDIAGRPSWHPSMTDHRGLVVVDDPVDPPTNERRTWFDGDYRERKNDAD